MDGLSQWDHGGGPPGSCDLDASTTINPLGPPFSMDLLWKNLSSQLAFYPDPHSESIRGDLSSFYSVPKDSILPGSGATVLLYRLFETLRPSRLLLPAPIFSEYPRAGKTFGIPMEFVAPGAPAAHSPWPIDPGFSGILKKACQGDLVVLVNPVNPTGEEISRDLVFFLGRELFKRGAFLMIDESFQDFIGRRSSALPDWADLASSLFVLKSFTKISGLAGIRSGALFGPPKILSKIREGMGPWSLGRMEQEVIAQLISSRQGSDGQCAVIKALLDDLEALLVRRNLHVSRGAGPFLMIRTGWGIHAASRARQSLDRLGVRLRIASGFGVSDGEDWVRIGFQGIINPERIVDTIESLSGE